MGRKEIAYYVGNKVKKTYYTKTTKANLNWSLQLIANIVRSTFGKAVSRIWNRYIPGQCFLLTEIIIYIEHCISLKCTTCWFDYHNSFS